MTCLRPTPSSRLNNHSIALEHMPPAFTRTPSAATSVATARTMLLTAPLLAQYIAAPLQMVMGSAAAITNGCTTLSPIALYPCIAGEQSGPTPRLLQVRQSPRQKEERSFDIHSHCSVVINLRSGMRVCSPGAIQNSARKVSNERACAPPSLHTPVATTIPLSFPCFSTAAATAAAHAAAVQELHIALNLGCTWRGCVPSVVKSAIKSLANSCKVSQFHTE